jgi:cell division protein FtsQ
MAVAAPADKRFRRAHVSPSKRRRFGVSWPRAAQTVLVAVFVGYAAYRGSALLLSADALTVSRISVTGNARMSRGEVLSLLDGLQGRNMVLLGLEDWRQKLMASPWVADAALRRVLPGTVDVVITERTPMAIARLANQRLYLIDAGGGIIDEYGPNYAELDLPLVDGLAAAPSQAGLLIDPLRAELVARLLTELQARPDLASRISQIDATDAHDAVVMLEGDTTLVRVGDTEFVTRLQSYLDLAPALRERVPAIDYVDLRFGERVYVRPAERRRSGS